MTRFLGLGLVFSMALLGAACGGDDDDDAPAADAGDLADAGELADGGAPADAGSTACLPTFVTGCTEATIVDLTGENGPIDINTAGFTGYAPDCIMITTGQTVRIQGTTTHPLVAAACNEVDFVAGPLTTTFNFTPDTVGDYAFNCNVHTNMKGFIRVVAP